MAAALLLGFVWWAWYRDASMRASPPALPSAFRTISREGLTASSGWVLPIAAAAGQCLERIAQMPLCFFQTIPTISREVFTASARLAKTSLENSWRYWYLTARRLPLGGTR